MYNFRPVEHDHTKAKLSGQHCAKTNHQQRPRQFLEYSYHQCNKTRGGSASTSIDTINSSATRELPSATGSPTSVAKLSWPITNKLNEAQTTIYQ
ncbi:unnamed protein product, partial [Onchocerca ochengi]|uniref:Uncharacterized protein n=1 Tax=Onchocerca ochengi TaxID=42157 RepID=A0A182EW52_ONCOC